MLMIKLTCIQLPILSQTTCESCTFSSTGKRPQSPAKLTATKAQQIPGCWISSSCSRVEFYRPSPDANRSVNYSSDSAQRCWSRWDIRQTPRRRCSTSGHLCRCAVSFVPLPRFGSRSTGGRGRSVRSLRDRWNHRRWLTAVKRGKFHQREDSARSNLSSTRTWGLDTSPALLRAIVRPTNERSLK